MQIAERNRLIKKVLTAEFGKGTVTVRGSRGTAYGWVSVKINVRPANAEQRDAFKARVWDLFRQANIEIDTYGYNDPGSDYGYGSKIHLDFDLPLDEFRPQERVTWNGKTGFIVEPNYRNPGWYLVKWQGEETPVEFYKRDLTRVVE